MPEGEASRALQCQDAKLRPTFCYQHLARQRARAINVPYLHGNIRALEWGTVLMSFEWIIPLLAAVKPAVVTSKRMQ